MEKKRYHIVIASIIFAIVAWISVNMANEYIVVRTVPVVLENLKNGKALKYPIPKNISVRLKGSGWLIASLYLLADVKYVIDVSSLVPGEFIITDRYLSEHISCQSRSN